MRGAMIPVRIEAARRDALRRLAAEDRRSMAGAMRHLIDDAPRRRGLMPADGEDDRAQPGDGGRSRGIGGACDAG
jgi:hypothetical protein